VSLIGYGGHTASSGVLRHVSSRNAFIDEAPTGSAIRLIPLARISRIIAANGEPNEAADSLT